MFFQRIFCKCESW